MASSGKESMFRVVISEDPRTVLVAERLRDGRVAMGTQVQKPDGEWKAGELHLLDPSAQLDLAAWLTPSVESGWLETVRAHQRDALRTADELYGENPGALSRFAFETLNEIPSRLLARAMVLLANSVGPRTRMRLVDRLNRTEDSSEEEELRRDLASENETFAYSLAAAALFDALSRGLLLEDLDDIEESPDDQRYP